jgi:hypothetical protein
MNDLENKGLHWDSFYSSDKLAPPVVPSQFAAFAASEFAGYGALVEFGCGNGRDSEFFGSLGLNVLATDASFQAIEACQSKSRHSNVTYRCLQAGDAADTLRSFVAEHGKIAVYGRFFLHAITPEEQANLFAAFAQALPAETALAFEYRTTGDADAEKAFGTHYRRFIDHAAFVGELAGSGYEVSYEIEGYGYAKYKTEDACVGRVVLRRL